MKKRFISLTLALALILSSVLVFTGCGDKDYPVDVANLTIEKEPESIVILDPCTADIVSFMGYDVKMVGRSDEVNQERLSIVPSVGSAANPDVAEIKSSGATMVFADSTLDSTAKSELTSLGIQVITMSKATAAKQLETNYVTLGKILGGKITGADKGAQAYKELIGDMDAVKTEAASANTTGVLYTVCYIYTENNELKIMTSGTYGDMLLGYTGAVNATVNGEDDLLDVSTLKIANPNFIFYSDESTLNTIKSDSTLGKLSAIKNKKTLMITSDEMSRQGYSALDTLQKMVGFMYPALAKTDTQETTAATAATTATDNANTNAGTNAQTATTAPASTQATAEATTVSTTLANKYKIKLDKLSLKKEDDNGNVKIMQQRLYDLGYITDKENLTGYYGDITEAAVKSFQENNGVKQTGSADNATLVKMFDSEAVENNE